MPERLLAEGALAALSIRGRDSLRVESRAGIIREPQDLCNLGGNPSPLPG